MLVHTFSGSPYAWRVLIALEEKGLDYETNFIARMSGDHKTPAMLTANPRGRVPVVEHGDLRLYESQAILDFLEREHPEPSLYPGDEASRALAMVRAAETDYLDVPFDRAIMYLWTTPAEKRETEEYDRLLGALYDEVARWEGYLSSKDEHGRGGGPYLGGEAVSMADIAFFPLLAFCVRVGFKLAPRFPALADYYARIVERPSIQATWPPHWRDSEGSDAGFADYDERHPVSRG
jgi:glutathione S-transferase